MHPAALAAREVARHFARDALLSSFDVVGAEEAPPGIRYPTADDYAASLIRAIDGVQPAVRASVDSPDDILSLPGKSFAAALAGELADKTGLSFAELASLGADIAALAEATSPSEIIATVQAVLDGSLKIAASVASAAGAAAGAVQVVPIIGQIVGALLGIAAAAAAAIEARERGIEACHRRGVELADARCSDILYTQSTILKTRSEGPTPSDIFRRVYYHLHSDEIISAAAAGQTSAGWVREQWAAWGRYLPMTVASMYVLLCGDAAPSKWHFYFKPPYLPLPKAWLPAATRRTLWRQVEAILMGTEEPGLSDSPKRIGDGGTAAFAIAQDIVWRAWNDEVITNDTLERIAGALTRSYKWHFQPGRGDCEGIGDDTAASYWEESCFTRVTQGLYDQFIQLQNDYQQRLFDEWNGIPGTTKVNVLALTHLGLTLTLRKKKSSSAAPVVVAGGLLLLLKLLPMLF